MILTERRKKNSPPPKYKHKGVGENIYVRDNFGLPVYKDKATEPSWVIKRRRFLEKLSVQDRNLLLTGDPYFQFDPIVYDCIFFTPFNVAPPLLQQQLGYLNPDEIVVVEDENDNNNDVVDNENVVVESDTEFTETESDSEGSNAYLTVDSSPDTPPCSPKKLTAPPPSPEASPLATRSGRPFNSLPQPSMIPSSTSTQLSSFLARAGRATSRLLQGHPLSTPPRHQSPHRTPKSKARNRTKR